jgi:hypothetical protein
MSSYPTNGVATSTSKAPCWPGPSRHGIDAFVLSKDDRGSRCRRRPSAPPSCLFWIKYIHRLESLPVGYPYPNDIDAPLAPVTAPKQQRGVGM